MPRPIVPLDPNLRVPLPPAALGAPPNNIIIREYAPGVPQPPSILADITT